jgi:hypothetical protein
MNAFGQVCWAALTLESCEGFDLLPFQLSSFDVDQWAKLNGALHDAAAAAVGLHTSKY